MKVDMKAENVQLKMCMSKLRSILIDIEDRSGSVLGSDQKGVEFPEVLYIINQRAHDGANLLERQYSLLDKE